MSILIGGSCVGLGKTTIDTKINELRQIRDGSYKDFWPSVDLCLDNKIPMYINADSYHKNHLQKGWNSEKELRDFIESIIIEFERRVADRNLGLYKIRNKTIFILDNEFEEVPGASIGKYIYWLKIFKSQIAGRYKIGAGNFSSHHKYMPWYRALCQHKELFHVLCIHLQADFNTVKNMEKNVKAYQQMIEEYGIKRVTCTEGIDTSWDLSKDLYLVEKQIEIAKILNCEGYCAVFIDANNPMVFRRWPKIVFTRYPKTWEKFKKIIKDNAPEEKDDEMELDEIYKEGSEGIGVRFIQKILNRDIEPKPLLKVDGIWGPKTDAVVLDYQIKHNLSQYEGAIGPNTFQDMVKQYPDIWDNVQYLWTIGIR